MNMFPRCTLFCLRLLIFLFFKDKFIPGKIKFFVKQKFNHGYHSITQIIVPDKKTRDCYRLTLDRFLFFLQPWTKW